VLENRLKPTLKLGGPTPRIDRIGAVAIRENPDLALASVTARRGHEAALPERMREAFGIALPPVGQFAAAAPLTAFWMAAEQWMVEAPYATHPDLHRRLETGLAPLASVTEQSDGYALFDVEGEGCLALFERLCNADIRRMPTGAVVRSTIEHMATFILCREQGRSYGLRGAGSSAISLHHALVTIARSIAQA
jgi:sarcosine oxidase subunit gamma